MGKKTGILLSAGALALAAAFLFLVPGRAGNAFGPSLAWGTVSRMVVQRELSGRTVEDLVPLPAAPPPGSVIELEISGKNRSGEVLKNIHAVGRIPRGCCYVGNSARCNVDAQVLLSGDNGFTFQEALPAGEGNGRGAAHSDETTDIKFVIPRVEPGAVVKAVYRMRMP